MVDTSVATPPSPLAVENEQLRQIAVEQAAALEAANDAITDLLHQLESAHAAGYTSPPSIWWSA